MYARRYDQIHRQNKMLIDNNYDSSKQDSQGIIRALIPVMMYTRSVSWLCRGKPCSAAQVTVRAD
jgi:hypothetical protein